MSTPPRSPFLDTLRVPHPDDERGFKCNSDVSKLWLSHALACWGAQEGCSQ